MLGVTARVLLTRPQPEPFPTLVGPHAEVIVIGDIPATDELCARLRSDPVDVLCPQVQDVVNDAVLEAGGDRLRGVCIMAVGYNNIDAVAAERRNIAVGNTPGVLTDATADCTMALLLDVTRRITEGDRMLRAGTEWTWAPTFMLGMELRDARLGIVGFGRIGQAVARRALAFGMRVAYVARPSTIVPPDLAGQVEPMGFEELLGAADVVSLHCPLNQQTHHLIDGLALQKMKPGAFLINTTRGSVVDEPALVAALRSGVIAGAGLDVYEAEPKLAEGLTALENVVLAPHLGSATVRTRAAMAELCALNTLAVLAGRLPDHCVTPGVIPRGAPA